MYNNNGGVIDSLNLGLSITTYSIVCAGTTVIAYYLYSTGKAVNEDLRRKVSDIHEP